MRRALPALLLPSSSYFINGKELRRSDAVPTRPCLAAAKNAEAAAPEERRAPLLRPLNFLPTALDLLATAKADDGFRHDRCAALLMARSTSNSAPRGSASGFLPAARRIHRFPGIVLPAQLQARPSECAGFHIESNLSLLCIAYAPENKAGERRIERRRRPRRSQHPS